MKVINGDAYFSGNSTWCQCGLGVMTMANTQMIYDSTQKGTNAESMRLGGEIWDVLNSGRTRKDKKEATAYETTYTYEEERRYDELFTLYRTSVSEFLALCAVGRKDVNSDSEWNAYLKELKDAGQEELLKITQTAYDRYQSSK